MNLLFVLIAQVLSIITPPPRHILDSLYTSMQCCVYTLNFMYFKPDVFYYCK